MTLISMRSFLFFLPLLGCLTAYAEPVPFHAEYVAEYRGLPIKAKGIRELVMLDDHTFKLQSSATSLLANVSEVSEFEYIDGEIKPLRYDYARTGLGKNKKESGQFNWTHDILEHNGSSSPLTEGTLDKLSYQYQLQTDVARAIAENNRQVGARI